jgi:hypothetical protein
MDQATSLVKNSELQLQNSNKTENPRLWTPNMDPQYGPQIWTLNIDPQLEPQYGPPIMWDDNFIGQIIGKSWGNHGESMGMPL